MNKVKNNIHTISISLMPKNSIKKIIIIKNTTVLSLIKITNQYNKNKQIIIMNNFQFILNQ